MKGLGFIPIVRFLALAALLASIVGLSASTNAAGATQRATTLADLPLAAQALISATVGRDDAAYQFRATAEGYRAANVSNTVHADFSNAGVRLEAGDAQWIMALRGIGYGDALEAVNAVAPTALANRLEYAHDTFTEWYMNGPAGLEQGWTLNTPPASRDGGALTLALVLEGRARVDARGQTVELLSEDGTTALRYTGLLAYDATGRDLKAWFELDGGGGVTPPLRIRVDDTGAQYPLTIDPYVFWATLSNKDGVANDHLGVSVAMSASGSTIAVGAYGVNGGKGAVYVFAKTIFGWLDDNTPYATLTNTNGLVNEHLGWPVAISADGSIIVAGAAGANSNIGAMYVFARPGPFWANDSTPDAMLTYSGGTFGDSLGRSVAISADGSTIVAGAPGVNSDIGAAYVFVKSASNWTTTTTPTAILSNMHGLAGDLFGVSVAISADSSTVVAGAHEVNGGQGAAYVFVQPLLFGWGNDSTPNATLINSSGAADDYLGYSVAISADGSTAVAGAWGVDASANLTDTGAAYVFVKPGGWLSSSTPNAVLANSTSPADDNLGWSVAISADGSIIALGAREYIGGPGAVDVFDRVGASWTNRTTPAVRMTTPGSVPKDFLGYSVAVGTDNSTVVAGAYGVNSYRGATYVFSYRPVKVYLPLIMK